MTTPTPGARRARRCIGRDGATIALGLAALALLALAVEPAWAQSAGPFGVAAPEGGGAVAHDGIFGWVATQQGNFYKALTTALKSLKTSPNAAPLLVGLSFAYGVFHAAGPGHGKAVIASYVVAHGETVRRGIVLSFISAFLQAFVAIGFVALATYVLRLTSMRMTEATEAFELTSAVLITALGLWLVWTKALRRGAVFGRGSGGHDHGHGHAGHHHDHDHGGHDHAAHRHSDAAMSHAGHGHRAHGHGHDHAGHDHTDHDHDHAHHAHAHPGHAHHGHDHRPAVGAAMPAAVTRIAAVEHAHDHDAGHVHGPDCGHSHAPDPRMLAGPFSLRKALSAVIAVGIRPCTGALIVLVFAFSQGLFLAGVLSTLAMAVGTGLTVSILAGLAVSAKSLALRFADAEGPWSFRIVRAAEVAGAVAILAMGVLLLGASFVGHASAG